MNPKKKTHIWQFDKFMIAEGAKKKNIKNVAKEDFFYPLLLEEWINLQIEQQGIEVIRKYTFYKDIEILKNEEKKKLLEWIYLQLIRTPIFQSLIFESINKGLEELNNKDLPVIPPDKFLNFPAYEAEIIRLPYYHGVIKKILWNLMSTKNKYQYELLSSHDWVIIENNSKYDFYTSDNPVIFYMPKSNEIPLEIRCEMLGNDLLVSPISIFFRINPSSNLILPLKPRKLLYICQKKYGLKGLIKMMMLLK